MLYKDLPNNSSLRWLLHDLMSVRPDEETKAAVQQLLARLDESEAGKIDAQFKRHRYAEQNLLYNRLSRHNEYPLDTLSASARSVLLQMLQCTTQSNLCGIATQVLAKTSGVTENTVRKALKELQNAGIIHLHRKANKHTPNVYKIDYRLCQSGTAVSESAKTGYIESATVDYLKLASHDYTNIYSKIQESADNNVIWHQYGTLTDTPQTDEQQIAAAMQQAANKAKGPNSAGNTDKPQR